MVGALRARAIFLTSHKKQQQQNNKKQTKQINDQTLSASLVCRILHVDCAAVYMPSCFMCRHHQL